MLKHLDLHKILFLDIETVPLYSTFQEVPLVEKKYFEEKNIERIVTYCEKDVVTVAQILLKPRNEALLNKKEILFSP